MMIANLQNTFAELAPRDRKRVVKYLLKQWLSLLGYEFIQVVNNSKTAAYLIPILSNLSRFLPDVIAIIMTIVICIFTSIFVFMKIEPFAADFFKWLWDLFECRLFSSLKKA